MLPSILYTSATVEVATANGSGGDAFTQKYFIKPLSMTTKCCPYPLHRLAYAATKFTTV